MEKQSCIVAITRRWIGLTYNRKRNVHYKYDLLYLKIIFFKNDRKLETLNILLDGRMKQNYILPQIWV